jgi:hypothetical protein
MTTYRLWAHNMFPKSNFRDTVQRIEVVCKKRPMQVGRRVVRIICDPFLIVYRIPQTQMKEWRLESKNPPKDDDRGNGDGGDGVDGDDFALPPPLSHPELDMPSEPPKSPHPTGVTSGIAQGTGDPGFTDADLAAMEEDDGPPAFKTSSLPPPRTFPDEMDDDAEAEAAMMDFDDEEPPMCEMVRSASTWASSAGTTQPPPPPTPPPAPAAAPEDEFDDMLDFDADELARLEEEAHKKSSPGIRRQEDNTADVNMGDDAAPRANGTEKPWEEEDIYE